MSQLFPSPKTTIELIPDTEQGGFTVRMRDIPVYGEGDTESEAINDLKIGLRTYIALFGLEKTLSSLHPQSFFREVSLSTFLGEYPVNQ